LDVSRFLGAGLDRVRTMVFVTPPPPRDGKPNDGRSVWEGSGLGVNRRNKTFAGNSGRLGGMRQKPDGVVFVRALGSRKDAVTLQQRLAPENMKDRDPPSGRSRGGYALVRCIGLRTACGAVGGGRRGEYEKPVVIGEGRLVLLGMGGPTLKSKCAAKIRG